jgi:hypothetical protein
MTLYRITDLDSLHRHLDAALQLEHATIPIYLTALYSIHPGTNAEGAHILRAVAVEEMLHLTLVGNLINALGGRPDLTRPGFTPRFPTLLPDGEQDFSVGLAPFSPAAIESFLKIERPASLNPEAGNLRPRAGRGHLLAAHAGGAEEHFFSIGEFYKAIVQGLEHLHDRMGPALFAGDPARQIGPEQYYSGGGTLIAITDLTTARAALDLIAEQGEGVTGDIFDEDGEIAHFYRFQQLLLGRYYAPGDAPGQPTGGPVPVDWSAVYPIRPNPRLADYPAGSDLRRAAEGFNAAYADYLALLTRAFDGQPDLFQEAVGEMFRLKERMLQLIRTPLDDGSGQHAAPTFEVNPMAEDAR